MKKRVRQILREAGAKSDLRDLAKLHGDASYRTYYRAILQNGETRIVMQMPKGLSSVSEEITNFSGAHKELPYIDIGRFLYSLGLPVPKIYKYSDADKMLIIEDIGDSLLAKFVNNADAKEQEEWYKKAIDLLVELQEKTASVPRPLPSPRGGEGAGEGDCVALQRSFDATLLNWEFDHFREYLIEARTGQPMKPSDRKLFEDVTRRIADLILQIPYCFVHRDFQSRNLMVRKDGSFVMIDFQDALLGPHVYDLVSLLRDSYVELEWPLVEEMVGYYCRHKEVQKLFKGGLKVVQQWFNLVTIQRKMKDAGRFVYIDRVKKNPNFLQYIPTTLVYIKHAFEQTSTLKHLNTYALFEALKNYVPEWQ